MAGQAGRALNLKNTLECQASRFGSKAAISMTDRRLTYRELDAASNRIGRSLLRLGIGRGKRAIILAENSPEYVAAYFGIVKTGAVAVPLDSKYKLPELAAIFRDAQPEVIFGDESTLKPLIPKFSGFPPVKHLIDLTSRLEGEPLTYRKIMAEEPDGRLEFEPEGEDIANINYTSGPTFTPRGVVLTHEHLVKSAAIYRDFMGQTENDVFIQFALPLHHVVGLSAIMLTAISGGSSVVIVPGLSIGNLLETVSRENGTIFMGVPFVYNLMIREASQKKVRPDLSSLRLAIVGAAPTPVKLICDFERLFGKKLIQFYGLTEANAFVTCQSPLGSDTPGSVGRPLAGWRLQITDPQGKALGASRDGEILVSGLLSRGYYNKSALTASTLKDGWLKTGDLGRFGEGGELYITGRIKDMIKVKGQNIYPSDIELTLSRHPAVAAVKVTGAPDAMRGEIVKAVVRLKEGNSATEEELRRFCLPYLANYKIPKQIEFVNS